jgi:hypothetical protein
VNARFGHGPIQPARNSFEQRRHPGIQNRRARLRHQHHHAAFPVIRQNRDSLSIIDQMPFGNHAVRHPQFQPKKPIPSIIDQMPGNNFRHICSVPQKLGMTLSQFAHFFVA